jgi:4-amino-4-deoxy-L-arabinose transferase-like glycosyltransferase
MKTLRKKGGEGGTPLQAFGILGLALALRLPVFWIAMRQYGPKWLFSRGIEMGLLADSLLHGRGLSSPFGDALGPTGPTAFIAPGYPVLIAAIFRIFGSYTAASEAAVIGLQIGLALLTIWLIMELAERLAGRRAALIAGLFWAISPPLLWIPTIFWETSFSIAMLTGLIWLVLRCRDNPAPGRWIALGAMAGAMLLFNSALLVTVAGAIAWLAWKTRSQSSARNAALCVAVMAAAFSPWPIRNARVFHAFIPLRTTVGFELWMGNREGATGYLEESLFPMYNKDELATYIAKGELSYTHDKSEVALGYIESHPARFTELTARRIFRFWTGTGVKGGSIFYGVQGCLTTALGLAGLWMLYRRNRHVATLFAIPLLLFPLPYYITHAEFRYRLVIDPLLTALTGCAIAWWGQEKRAQASRG